MSDPHAMSHRLTELIASLIRSALLADEDAIAARRDAFRAHQAILAELPSTDLSGIRLDGLWSLAKGKVQSAGEFDNHPLLASRQLTATCPLSIEELTAPGLSTTEIEEKIRGAGSLG